MQSLRLNKLRRGGGGGGLQRLFYNGKGGWGVGRDYLRNQHRVGGGEVTYYIIPQKERFQTV